MSLSNGHIQFQCTQCSQPIRLRSQFAGKRCRCTNCRHEMTVPMESSHDSHDSHDSDDSDLGGSAGGVGGASGSSASRKYLGRKRQFRKIPRCPACDTRLVLIGTMKSDPMLRCGKCGSEFMNQFFGSDRSDESAGPEGNEISDELRESWKGIFGGGDKK